MPPAGWYPDPADLANIRYWDGGQWTDRVQPKSVPPPPGAGDVPMSPPAPVGPPVAVPPPTPQAPPAPVAGYGYPPAPGQQAPQLLDPYSGYTLAPPPGPAVPGKIGPDGQLLSGWWRRVGGYLIDSIIVGIPVAIAFLVAAAVIQANGGALFYEDRMQEINDAILAGDTTLDPFAVFDAVAPGFWTAAIIAGAVYLIGSLLNGVYLVARSGQTLGDRAVSVRKVMAGRTVPTFGVALARWLIPNVLFQLIGYLVPLGFILTYADYLWPVWDRKGQTLHDKMVRTYVERSDMAGPPVPRHGLAMQAHR